MNEHDAIRDKIDDELHKLSKLLNPTAHPDIYQTFKKILSILVLMNEEK